MLKINVKNVNVTQSPIPQHFTTAIIYKKTADGEAEFAPTQYFTIKFDYLREIWYFCTVIFTNYR